MKSCIIAFWLQRALSPMPTTANFTPIRSNHETDSSLGTIRTWQRNIPMTKEIGFDTIDIFADPLDLDIKERMLIKRECDKVNLPIVSVACVAVGLLDFNPSVQRFHVQRCRAYLDLVYELEAKNLLLVLGEYIWEKQVIPPAEQW